MSDYKNGLPSSSLYNFLGGESGKLVQPTNEYLTYIKDYESEISGLYQHLFDSIQEKLYMHAGAGSYFSTMQKNFSKIDRYGTNYISPNTEYCGYTFITRPRLCLQTPNLLSNRYLMMYNTDDPDSIQFMIRSMLDSNLATYTANTTGSHVLKDKQILSPWIDPENPFITLLTNNLTDASGFPSQEIQTATNEGGYFSEDQTIAKGSDNNKKSFDVSLSFTDPEGGPIMALFQLWMTYMALLTTGEVVAYADDIEQQRLCYTSSIYRFTVDSSRRIIKKMAKCTGCFPRQRNGGACFDVSMSSRFVEAARKFNISFVCNAYDENDPIIAMEFNTLMKRYAGWIDGWHGNAALDKRDGYRIENEQAYHGGGLIQPPNGGYGVVPIGSEYNYMGLPFINMHDGRRPPELEFRYHQLSPSTYYLSNSIDNTINKIDSLLEARNATAYMYNKEKIQDVEYL